ncbi:MULTISPECIES: hypothetical protein [unclassified Hyphomicrobium]|uniref:hypothetical protein n=1 Tax=unclassified Hyphomicrobium TaxID=2619925 RepID=UPI000213E679|nr:MULTISPECIES: hypothetical protein [unclassified Hyphomicrobium]CCB65931.1 conserved protein of unknown function [Hyphomicrobium sp. MC1]
MASDPPRPAKPQNETDTVDEKQLQAVLRDVPEGAFALAGTAVGILVLAYLFLYFLVFLPRGPIG